MKKGQNIIDHYRPYDLKTNFCVWLLSDQKPAFMHVAASVTLDSKPTSEQTQHRPLPRIPRPNDVVRWRLRRRDTAFPNADIRVKR